MCETKRYWEAAKESLWSNDNISPPKLRPYEEVVVWILEKLWKFWPTKEQGRRNQLN